MRLIDVQAFEDYLAETNNSLEELTRLEVKRMESVMWDMPEVQAIPIPEGATNGDMIKAMNPNDEFEFNVFDECTEQKKEGHVVAIYTKEYWLTPYRREVE